MRLKCILLAAVVAAFAPPVTSAQEAIKGEAFSSLVVFSGSLSDTGNFPALYGDLGPPFAPNRTTNGPNVIDVFAGKYGLSSEPSLHLTGEQAGLNYAVLHANAAGDSPADLPGQVRAYLDSHSRADSKALYFVFIGANDIVSATVAPTDEQARAILNDAIDAVDSAFRDLHAAGARTFYAPNNVNIGRAPIALQFGVSARATELTLLFNRMWERKLRQLERQLGVVIFRFDFYRQIEDIIDVAGILGFTDVTHSCVALLPSGQCDLNRFGFINELLPTQRIHEFFGNALAESLAQQMRVRRPPRGPGRKIHLKPYSFIDLQDRPFSD
jgi:outer membrane lipase/esterase